MMNLVLGMVNLVFGMVYLEFGMVYLIFGKLYLVFWMVNFGIVDGEFENWGWYVMHLEESFKQKRMTRESNPQHSSVGSNKLNLKLSQHSSVGWNHAWTHPASVPQESCTQAGNHKCVITIS